MSTSTLDDLIGMWTAAMAHAGWLGRRRISRHVADLKAQRELVFRTTNRSLSL